MASLFPPAICTATSFGQLFRNKKHPSSRPTRIPCNSTNTNRRNILIGLGGASFLSHESSLSSFAAPIQTPDITNCGPPDPPSGNTNCCPPPTTSIIDFQPPDPGEIRVRPAAHLVDQNYIEKYKLAVELMKALPDSDPRSFMQQANIHCAYCDGAYDQLGFPVEVQVHHSWLFFPFHRWYLYFHEKILGELIDDPTFALPFWNYDAPEGMQIPSIYTDNISPLYDEFRDQNHLPPTLLDLDYNGVDTTIDNEAQITSNLTIMNRQMVSNSSTPLLFFGSPYLAGDEPSPGMGSVEISPHNTVHGWCGDKNQPNAEDMGSFYSAARDPIFYAHHNNIDRLWSIWKTLGDRRQDLEDPDWLNASFVFYNEKAQAVRAYVRDCLQTETLGYVFQDVEIPWLQTQPIPSRAIANATSQPRGPSATRVRSAEVKFPITLNVAVSTQVKRPRKSRTEKDKEENEEILVISGIEYDANTSIKFDVLINDEDDKEIRVDNTEFAGSFVNVPHNPAHKKKGKTTLRLGLTQILQDLNADDDDAITITLLPKVGVVSIAGINIQFD